MRMEPIIWRKGSPGTYIAYMGGRAVASAARGVEHKWIGEVLLPDNTWHSLTGERLESIKWATWSTLMRSLPDRAK